MTKTELLNKCSNKGLKLHEIKSNEGLENGIVFTDLNDFLDYLSDIKASEAFYFFYPVEHFAKEDAIDMFKTGTQAVFDEDLKYTWRIDMDEANKILEQINSDGIKAIQNCKERISSQSFGIFCMVGNKVFSYSEETPSEFFSLCDSYYTKLHKQLESMKNRQEKSREREARKSQNEWDEKRKFYDTLMVDYDENAAKDEIKRYLLSEPEKIRVLTSKQSRDDYAYKVYDSYFTEFDSKLREKYGSELIDKYYPRKNYPIGFSRKGIFRIIDEVYHELCD